MEKQPMTRTLALAAIVPVLLLIPARKSHAQEHAPLPDSLVSAETVYLVNDSGDLKAYDTFLRN
jgi:hypothetical protein